MPESDEPIVVERSPEAKRAYAQGFKAGGETALSSLRRGLSTQQAEDHFLTMYSLIEWTIDDFDA